MLKDQIAKIGIKRALGAKNATICIQFLIELITFCLLGAILEMLLSVGAGTLGFL